MSDATKTPSTSTSTPDPAGPVLRIVKDSPPTKEDPPGQNNPFVKFMTAYANAIDDEVKAILSL